MVSLDTVKKIVRKVVHFGNETLYAAHKIVVGYNCGNGGKQTGSRGDKGFRDAGEQQ